MYRTIYRAGEVNSLGVYTNFIFYLDLMTKEPVDKWILKSVALFTQID